jgi:hypothetical protein
MMWLEGLGKLEKSSMSGVVRRKSTDCMSSAGFLLGSFFDAEDGDMFLQTVF